jgi:hypothetical protein
MAVSDVLIKFHENRSARKLLQGMLRHVEITVLPYGVMNVDRAGNGTSVICWLSRAC